jgi:hypothetical protein
MNNIFYTTYLMGGLGNQMFQIAHTYSQGLRKSIIVKFRPSAYTPMQANQPTKYTNNIFRNINFETFTSKLVSISSEWKFKEINPPIDQVIEFFGYFQSNKNFYGFDNQIRELFEPTDDFIVKIKNLYPEILSQKNVSLHIRRGDYLTISDILPTISKSYIESCLNKIREYDNIFVFSDDKDWIKKNINYEKIIFVEGLEDYEELWTISLCHTNIMSNSSFSWWGSFLNKNENKKIYCPSIWFGPKGEKDYQDIYINDWIKVDTFYENGEIKCY